MAPAKKMPGVSTKKAPRKVPSGARRSGTGGTGGGKGSVPRVPTPGK